MSQIVATVSKIVNQDSLHIVEFESHKQTLCMMSLDLNEAVKVGVKVKLVVKPTHIVIAKEFSGEISFANRLDASVSSIDAGALLCSVKLNFFDTILESIVTLKSAQEMNLQVGDRVTAFIQASELSIGEIIDV